MRCQCGFLTGEGAPRRNCGSVYLKNYHLLVMSMRLNVEVVSMNIKDSQHTCAVGSWKTVEEKGKEKKIYIYTYQDSGQGPLVF